MKHNLFLFSTISLISFTFIATRKVTEILHMTRKLKLNEPFKCPEGSKIVQKNPPTWNGCGTDEFNTLANLITSEYIPCCDDHDICYSTCKKKNSQKLCDDNFYICLKSRCTGYCVLPDLMYQAVSKLGTYAWDRAQNESCTCV